MLPSHPRLRPLEIFPLPEAAEGGGARLCLRDPSGFTDKLAVLPPAAVVIVALCDGTRDVAAVQDEIERRYHERVPRESIEGLLDQLDEGLFLDSPRFHAHRRALIEAFGAAPRRAAAHAGTSYPAGAEELRRFLDAFFANDAGPKTPPHQRRGGDVHAVIAPHIDFHRGGPTYAHTYLPLHDMPRPPELVVIFGTDHNGAEQPFTLTRKAYETPLGTCETDVDLVERLCERAGGAALFADELHHRHEHSIEFQAVALRHCWPDADLRILPILVGSFHAFVADGDRADPASDPAIARFIDELGDALSRRSRVLFIAGADLAHVGPRFGDRSPLDADDRRALAAADDVSLERCVAGDALGFFRSVARDGDARRVCGLSPIYAMLRVAGGRRGRRVAYDQCAADDDGGSLVSIAGVVY